MNDDRIPELRRVFGALNIDPGLYHFVGSLVWLKSDPRDIRRVVAINECCTHPMYFTRDSSGKQSWICGRNVCEPRYQEEE